VNARPRIQPQLDEFLERVELGTFRADLDGRLTDGSPAMRRLLHARSEADLGGLVIFDLCVDRNERGALRSLLASRGRVIAREVELRCRDGATAWFSLSMGLAATPEGDRWIDGLVQDISSRKRTEEALVASEERFRHLVETTGVIPWEIDLASWRFTYVGAQVEQILGFPPEAWRDPAFWEARIHPADRTQAIAAWRDRYRTEDEYQFAFRVITSGGLTVWLHNVVSVTYVDEVPSTLHGFLIDDTTRVTAEMASREAERRLRDLLENVALVAVALDAGGRIVFANDFLLDLTGWARQEVLAADWFERFVPPDQREWVKSMFADNIAAGSIPSHVENEIVTRDGRRRLLRWNNTILRDPDGQVVGTASIGEDITVRLPTPDSTPNLP
jgi:PAS domain S-box-containing protein